MLLLACLGACIVAVLEVILIYWECGHSASRIFQCSLKPNTCSHRALIMLDLQTSIWTFPKQGIWFQSLDWLFLAVGEFDGKNKTRNRNLQSDTKWHFVAPALSVHTAPTNQSNSFPSTISHCFLNGLNWDHLERKPRVPVTSN